MKQSFEEILLSEIAFNLELFSEQKSHLFSFLKQAVSAPDIAQEMREKNSQIKEITENFNNSQEILINSDFFDMIPLTFIENFVNTNPNYPSKLSVSEISSLLFHTLLKSLTISRKASEPNFSKEELRITLNYKYNKESLEKALILGADLNSNNPINNERWIIPFIQHVSQQQDLYSIGVNFIELLVKYKADLRSQIHPHESHAQLDKLFDKLKENLEEWKSRVSETLDNRELYAKEVKKIENTQAIIENTKVSVSELIKILNLPKQEKSSLTAYVTDCSSLPATSAPPYRGKTLSCVISSESER